jgi:CheY-like chemotaxis protein
MIKKNPQKRKCMQLLTDYQNELIICLLVILLLYAAFVIKRRTKDKEQKKVDTPITEKLEIRELQNKLPPQEKQEVQIKQQKDQEPQSAILTTQTAQNRAVPAHAKITKEDFKEFSGARILIAEDNIINQKVMLGLLAESGIEITIANDGVEVLETLQRDSDFSLILMDAHMPRLDGFEATRKIKAEPMYAHINIVALSGDIGSDDVAKMLEAGMQEHLEKPLKMDALYNVFDTYLTPQNTNSHILDTEEGLYICGSDNNFYKEILEEFVQNYQKSDKELQKMLAENNFSSARNLLLDIIGVSANIGATQLTQTATHLKTSLEEKEKRDALLQSFSQQLSHLLQEIKKYIKEK